MGYDRDQAVPITTSRWRALTPNLRGGLWLVASAACFTISVSLIKHLGVTYSAPMQTFYAQSMGVLLLAPYTLKHAARILRPKRAKLLLMRSALSTAGLMLAFFSYQQLPLADANALSFTRALWVFPFAALILGERIGMSVVLAGVAAFGGVLLIGGVTGGHAQWGWGMAAGLASAMVTALIAVTVRGLSRDTDGMTLLIWGSLLGVVFSAPVAMLTGWQWPHRTDLWLLAIQGVFAVGQQACYIRGLQIGEASAVAPFDYTRIVFVVLIGIFVFHEVPPFTTIAGMAVIVGAALFLVWSLSRCSQRSIAEAKVAS